MAPSPTIRRLMKETAELSSSAANPNPAFYAAPVSDEDLHEWHFTLLGPPAPSPYAGGLYHGRITLPPSYPLKPPNFRFLTPTGRFEVNRAICLSISGYHEETWMPAWGVRTALTALRSFMAEPGSAGQVGGLEASKELRKQFMEESKGWKCAGCGGKTNQQVMEEWWGVCRDKGVKVDEEGVDIGLDALPEGMEVEARSPGPKSENEKLPNQEEHRHQNMPESPPSSRRDQSSQPSPLPAPQARHPPSSTRSALRLPPADSHSHAHSHSRTHSIPLIPTPSAEATQASAEGMLTPSDRPSTSSGPNTSPTSNRATTPPTTRPMMMNIHAPPLAAANAALSERGGNTSSSNSRQRRGNNGVGGEMITIDRAIAGVFLALCLMVLKKMFYPASNNPGGMGGGAIGNSDAGGGAGDFWLQREM